MESWLEREFCRKKGNSVFKGNVQAKHEGQSVVRGRREGLKKRKDEKSSQEPFIHVLGNDCFLL
jgi:hypothetical protein